MSTPTTAQELTAMLEALGSRLQDDLPDDCCYVLIVASGHMRTAETNMTDEDALGLVRDIAEDMATDPSRVTPKGQGEKLS